MSTKRAGWWSFPEVVEELAPEQRSHHRHGKEKRNEPRAAVAYVEPEQNGISLAGETILQRHPPAARMDVSFYHFHARSRARVLLGHDECPGSVSHRVSMAEEELGA